MGRRGGPGHFGVGHESARGIWWCLRGALAAGALLLPLLASTASVRLKLAMLAPERSVWDTEFKAMAKDTRSATRNGVALRVYPGGVQGDEPTVVRKMRIGQLQGGSSSREAST